MASLAKRKQQVNQLRKAHFPFGFAENNGEVSEYKQQYNEKTLSHLQPNGDRKSHFTIGSDEPSMANNTYQSQFKEKYPEHPQAPRQLAKKSNDENNIVLGFGTSEAKTNYKDQFVQKQTQKNQPVNQRVISVDLGDTLTDFTTSYNKAFDGTQGARTQPYQNPNSNLVFGYDQGQFVTSNAASHNIKPISNSKGPGRSYQTNISLGTDGGQFNSEHKTQFSHKNGQIQSVDKQRVLDFKSAHFKFGFPEQTSQNLTEAQENYKQKPLNTVKAEGNRATNVELKHDSNNYFNSSYTDHFQQKQGEKTEILDKNGRNSSVVIGMGKETYQSEAREQFGAKRADVVRGKGAEGSLNLGDEGREFSTQYQQTHTNKFKDHQSNQISKEEIEKMKREHFVSGFTDPDYKLHSQAYGVGNGEGNRLPREVIDKMRSTNIVTSDNNEFQGKTIHNSSYGWKRNDDF